MYPWIVLICSDDGTWNKVRGRFQTKALADEVASDFESTYGNIAEVLCSW